jgi:hypothetical protein
MREAFIWARQADFLEGMRLPLRDLNLRFLDLAASRESGSRHDAALRLPNDAALSIAPLSRAQRAAAANCPYALFDLRLSDDARWRARAMTCGDWIAEDQSTVAQDLVSFVRQALFYAWHIASTSRPGLQLWLGMAEKTAAMFRGMTLNGVSALAASEASQLTARWYGSTFFWNTLTLAASRDDGARLREIHLFGLQLAAGALLP